MKAHHEADDVELISPSLSDSSSQKSIRESTNYVSAASSKNMEDIKAGLISIGLKFLFENVEHPRDNSKLITIFLILNTMIGSGILNQPQVFSKSGVFGALIVFMVSSYFTWLGLVTLIDCGTRHNKSDYSALAKYSFGKFGEKIVDICIVTYTFGGLMSYITVVGGTSSGLVSSWGCQNDAFCGIYIFTCFMVFCFVLPLCLLQHYGHLGILSVISIMAIASVLLLVIIGGPITRVHGTILLISMRGTFIKMGSVIFALSCSSATFHAYESMKERSLEIWTEVTFWSVVIGTFMCCIMGIAGYLSFKQDTSGEILENFPGTFADFFKTMLVVHLCLYIPVDFLVMRHSVIRLFGSETGILPIFKHTILTISLLTVTTFLVLVLVYVGFTQGAAFGLILDFTGGIAGSCISFVMPAAMFLKLTSKDHKLFVPSIFMFCFGIFAMITVPVVTIINFVES